MQTTMLRMRSAIGAAAARAARALATLALAPFYAGGLFAAAVIMAGRHIRAAVATGWEDVMGQEQKASSQSKTPKPPAPAPELLSEPGDGWRRFLLVVGGAALLLALLGVSLILWIVFIRLVATG